MARIVVLSRGHGYGHAAKDHRIIESLWAQRGDLEITVASSGLGVEYYKAHSIPCIDLGIPDHDDQGHFAHRRVLRFFDELTAQEDRVDFVVANEVFWAAPVCSMLDIDIILLTHWFFSEVGNPQADHFLRYANSVIVLDEAENHQVPNSLGVPVYFSGLLANQFSLTRLQARQALGLDRNCLMAVATFGSLRPDKLHEISSLLNLVLATWREYAPAPCQLFILADVDIFSELVSPWRDESVKWVGVTKTPELYYAAADVVIAYATFTTLSELVRNAVPTVGVIGSLNPVDTFHARSFESLGLIQAASLDVCPGRLWTLGQIAMQRQTSVQSAIFRVASGGPERVAHLILSHLPA